uniref:Uncharacterized protein n=1 Tax=Manihot esculenta TaxID=3983 RepID=A0A2C9VP70_MANES
MPIVLTHSSLEAPRRNFCKGENFWPGCFLFIFLFFRAMALRECFFFTPMDARLNTSSGCLNTSSGCMIFMVQEFEFVYFV